MNIHKIHFLIIAILITSFGYAQSYKEHRGDIYSSRFNYDKAIEQYLIVMENEPENHYVMRKLAECYKYSNNDSASVQWYSKLISTNNNENIDLYNYSVVLKNIGEYDKSGEILKQYAVNKKDDKYLLSNKYIKDISKDTLLFKVTLIENSSPVADFAPSYLGDKIIFVSSRQGTNILQQEYERTGQAYLQLFVADTVANGQLDSIQPFERKFKSRFHEGPISFCEADSNMYFTRNNYKIFKGVSSDGEVKLKIYRSKFTYNEWLKDIDTFIDSLGYEANLDYDDWRSVKEFQYNSKEYSTGHPTLTKDGRKMYFVSDMPGGMGGTDIYVCERVGKNEWSEPQNIRLLNTEGNEMFPFIHESGMLFFASDGLPGIGGLDIFKAAQKGDGFEKPVNIGAPINSIDDDFGLIADKDTKTGYFTSNRSGGKGDDDLYHVEFINKVEFVLAGVVTQKGSTVPVANATITFKSNKKGDSQVFKTNNKGFYFGTIDFTKTFTTSCEEGLYLPFSGKLNPKDISLVNDTLFYNIELDFYGIYGSVFLKESNEKVPSINLECDSGLENEILSGTSDTIGDFKILLAKDTDYELMFTKTDFFALRESYTTKDKQSGWVNVNEFIELAIVKIDVNKTIEIPNIYYDLSKWDIRPDAAIELDKVVVLLVDNPDIHIELGSHTDARGSAKSNQFLSQKRAQSAVDYIVSQGIDGERIVAMGFGETKLKNHCADGVPCSKEEHQQNRRTDIRVTSVVNEVE